MNRIKFLSFPRPSLPKTQPYNVEVSDIESELYSRVLKLDPNAKNLLVGPTSRELHNHLKLESATYVIDGLDQLNDFGSQDNEGSMVVVSDSLLKFGQYENLVTLDSPLICPSPILKFSDVQKRLHELADCVEEGGHWWLVVPNLIYQKQAQGEQIRFTSSLREIPAPAENSLSSHYSTLIKDLDTMFGSSFSASQIWSIYGPTSSPTNLRLEEFYEGNLPKQESYEHRSFSTNGSLESLKLKAVLGPQNEFSLNSGWLICLKRESTDLNDQTFQIPRQRTLADELHSLIMVEQLTDAGRVLMDYQQDVLAPFFKVAAHESRLKNYAAKYEHDHRTELALKTTSSERLVFIVNSLIEFDAFEKCQVSGDYGQLEIQRNWETYSGTYSPIDAGLNIETYLSAELLFFLSQWVFPKPPRWLEGSLTPKQLIAHLIGLANLSPDVIVWEALTRMQTDLPLVFQVPIDQVSGELDVNLGWSKSSNINSMSQAEMARLISDQQRLIKRWRKRLLLNRLKRLGADEAKLVGMYRRLTRTNATGNRT